MSNIVDFYTPNTFLVLYLEILTPRIPMEDNLEFTFTLENTSEHSQVAEISYEIAYHSADGSVFNKSYPLISRKCPKGYLLLHRRIQLVLQDLPSIAPGLHELSIIVNGSRLKTASFWITDVPQ